MMVVIIRMVMVMVMVMMVVMIRMVVMMIRMVMVIEESTVGVQEGSLSPGVRKLLEWPQLAVTAHNIC